MNEERLFPTEKMILRHKLASCERLNTRVKQFKRKTKLKNTVLEHQIGRYRPLKSRMCVTAEMKIIKQYIEKKKQMPPSFFEAGPRKYLFFDPQKVRIGIVTPGGIAPGINTVIHSIVNMHCKIYGMTRSAYGFLFGFEGLAENRRYNGDLDPSVTIDWIHTGGTFLGAGRGEKDVSAMVTNLEQLGIHILYVIGGDGSLTAAHLIAEEIRKRKRKIAVAGIPKTMDNDVLWVWHSFGFDTAVEEATRLVNALHDEAQSTRKVCVVPLFGRNAGFVAAHTALASGQVDVVLIPEVPFRMNAVLNHVQNVVADKGYALVVVAEGVCPRGEKKNLRKRIRERGLNPDEDKDPKVHQAFQEEILRLLQEKFEERFEGILGGKHRVFVNAPRYIVRAIPANSVDQIYCRRLADLAVHSTLAGFTGFMISQWLTEYVLVPLKLVAGGHKRIPPGGIFWKTVISSTGQPSFDR